MHKNTSIYSPSSSLPFLSHLLSPLSFSFPSHLFLDIFLHSPPLFALFSPPSSLPSPIPFPFPPLFVFCPLSFLPSILLSPFPPLPFLLASPLHCSFSFSSFSPHSPSPSAVSVERETDHHACSKKERGLVCPEVPADYHSSSSG